jgi:glycerophosphoryl diester phosphodiesterase
MDRPAAPPTSRRRVARRAAASLVCALAAAGCGDDGGGRDDAGGTTTEAAAAPTGSAPTATSAPPAVDGVVVVAHRGASGHAPEHTFAAYDLALEQGADYLEQDLQVTADGELVVLHDETLDRTARGPAEACTGRVADKTLAQLRECEVGSWFNEANPDLADPAYADEPMPTMREVLDRYGTDVRYYIELKAPGAAPGMEQALLDLLDEAGLGDTGASRQVLVQSFFPESLQAIHELRPDLPLVQLLPDGAPIDGTFLDDVATYAVAIGPAAAQVDDALVEAAHERCLDVHPYTVDEPAEMARLLAAAVDGMFTNVPDVLIEARDAAPAPEAIDDGCDE